MHKHEFIKECEEKILWYFSNQRISDLMLIKKKKKRERNYSLLNFVVPTDLSKIKESEKRDKYLDLARKLRKPWNTRVTLIHIVTGALETVLRSLEREEKKWKSEEESRPLRL